MAEIEFDYGPGTFDYPAAAAGLSGLSSYKATLMLSFDGTEAGQPGDWSKSYVMMTARDSATRQMTLMTTGDGDEPEQLYRAELNGVAYERRGATSCTAGAIYEPDALAARWEPAGFLTGVTGAVAAGSETVNGVAADRYTFDARAFGSLPPAESTGELWVAAEGGYLVRYLVTTVGTAEYFGEGIEGALTWDYQLTDANALPAIELPAECSAGLLDVPVLPDAADLVRVPDLVTYVTASSAADTAAFYQRELPALGWQPAGDAAVSEGATVQGFTRGGKELSLIITTSAGRSTVRLFVSPGQP